MPGTSSFSGRCHCGNVELAFETPTPPEELAIRACACSFCRRHGVRTVSDPKGRARVLVRDPTKLNRYRFGLRTADFLVCRKCGVYVGAVYTDDTTATYAVLNVNAFDTPGVFPPQASVVDYERKRRGAPLPAQGQLDTGPGLDARRFLFAAVDRARYRVR
jgi:hypothetical protein